MTTTARIKLPPKLVPVFAPPRGAVRYRGAYGGRGSGKSFSFAKMAAVFGYVEPLRILATREFQASIKESFHAELKAAIESEPWLADHYEVGEAYIRGKNGTEFIFRGLRHNISSIKSTANIDICILEEAEDVPDHSWRDLEPTIRAPKSEIWCIWNPKDKGSPVDKRLRQRPPDNAVIAELQWLDNPWFPDVLDDVRRRDQELFDPAVYAHIWEGQYLEESDVQVLAGKVRVAEFEPGDDWDGPYYGLDFGFSVDPTAGVRMWIHEGRLYVDHELYQVGLPLDDTKGALVYALPGSEDHVVRADSARPETIHKLNTEGLRVVGSKKGAGSVKAGVELLRSFREIVIHPRCKHTIEESRLWSYKTDRLTGDPRPELVDKHNHCWDAARYGLEPLLHNSAGPRIRSL